MTNTNEHIEQRFLFEQDIEKILNISRASAYRVIKELNAELQKQGYLTVAGRIPTKYFYQRYYC